MNKVYSARAVNSFRSSANDCPCELKGVLLGGQIDDKIPYNPCISYVEPEHWLHLSAADNPDHNGVRNFQMLENNLAEIWGAWNIL